MVDLIAELTCLLKEELESDRVKSFVSTFDEQPVEIYHRGDFAMSFPKTGFELHSYSMDIGKIRGNRRVDFITLFCTTLEGGWKDLHGEVSTFRGILPFGISVEMSRNDAKALYAPYFIKSLDKLEPFVRPEYTEAEEAQMIEELVQLRQTGTTGPMLRKEDKMREYLRDEIVDVCESDDVEYEFIYSLPEQRLIAVRMKKAMTKAEREALDVLFQK